MRIRTLEVQNYKSLKHVKVDDMKQLSVFVGANGSGKTNFTDCLDFIGDAFRDGLAKAIDNRGGFENICYRESKRASFISVKIDVEYEHIHNYIVEYGFTIKLASKTVFSDYSIENEVFSIYSPTDPQSSRLALQRIDNKLAIKNKPHSTHSDAVQELLEKVENFSQFTALKSDELMIVTLGVVTNFFHALISDLLGRIRVYQINPLTCRKGGTGTTVELGRHGENTSTVLKLLKDKRPFVYQQIEEFMQNIMPGLEEIRFSVNSVDRTISLEFKEAGVKRAWNVGELSDGTIRILSMLMAVANPSHKVVVIEEPENSIHARLLVKFYEFCTKVAQDKQIILTTHSITMLNEWSEETGVYVVYRQNHASFIKPLSEFEGITKDLEYEAIGDLIFTGRVKEYLPGYGGVSKDE